MSGPGSEDGERGETPWVMLRFVTRWTIEEMVSGYGPKFKAIRCVRHAPRTLSSLHRAIGERVVFRMGMESADSSWGI